MRTVIISSRYLLLIFFFILLSCRTADNYKLLSFFFDGVPNPEDQKKIILLKDGKKVVQRKPTVIITYKSEHPDYDKRKCYSCHSQSRVGSLKTIKKDLCFSCHKKEKFDGKFIHGPVAVKKCLVCHLPHNSKYEKLLVKESNELCMDCHIRKKEDTTDPCDRGEKCTTCHAPHALDNKYFLKNIKGLNLKKEIKKDLSGQ